MRNDEWRILVGEDAKALDRMVRESPETAYEQSFMQALQAQGHLRMGGWRSPGRRGGRSAMRGTHRAVRWGGPGTVRVDRRGAQRAAIEFLPESI